MRLGVHQLHYQRVSALCRTLLLLRYMLLLLLLLQDCCQFYLPCNAVHNPSPAAVPPCIPFALPLPASCRTQGTAPASDQQQHHHTQRHSTQFHGSVCVCVCVCCVHSVFACVQVDKCCSCRLATN